MMAAAWRPALTDPAATSDGTRAAEDVRRVLRAALSASPEFRSLEPEQRTRVAGRWYGYARRPKSSAQRKSRRSALPGITGMSRNPPQSSGAIRGRRVQRCRGRPRGRHYAGDPQRRLVSPLRRGAAERRLQGDPRHQHAAARRLHRPSQQRLRVHRRLRGRQSRPRPRRANGSPIATRAPSSSPATSPRCRTRRNPRAVPTPAVRGAAFPSAGALEADLGLGDSRRLGARRAAIPERVAGAARAQRKLAKTRQEMLATMVLLGMQRIVVESAGQRGDEVPHRHSQCRPGRPRTPFRLPQPR